MEWSRAGAADWQPCLDLGDGRWRPAATAGLAGEPLVLRYAFAAEGPWSPASPDAKVLVTGLPFWPFWLAAPALAGTGRIGTEVTVDPGLWVGDPLPSLALQWRCDGVDIPGATGPAFVPGPAEDGRELACAVTAGNLAGSATAVTAALRVTYTPPVARGALLEEIFDEDSGPQTVDAATDFVGENLSWSVAGAGATIDAAGLVSIPTDTPLAELVTVTATNSGGAAASGFMVTVEAADAPEIPLTPTAADWALEAVSLAPDTHTGVFTLSPALGAVEVQWLGVDVASYATEAELEPHYNPTVALGGNRWRHASPAGKSVHLRANGTSLPHIRMRYRIAADGAWSSYSEDRRTLDASLLPAEPPAAGWSVMPFRTDARGSRWACKGGDQGQMWHGMNRSASDPSLIIARSGHRRDLVVRRRRADLEQEPRRGPARLRHAGRAGRPRGPEPLVWRRRGAVPDRRQRRRPTRHLPLDRQGRALGAGLLRADRAPPAGAVRRSSMTRAPAARA